MTDSDSTTGGIDHADEFRPERIECGNGRVVDVEEYPGGDMTIYTGRSEMYLRPEEAAALRTAIGRIDADKAPTDTDKSDD